MSMREEEMLLYVVMVEIAVGGGLNGFEHVL